MFQRSLIIVLFITFLAALPANADGIYTKNSPVLQVDGKSYDQLIARSNHTSILEFYAPWCGHCQNLKPAYEKAAKNLQGLAKVAAINCDDEPNKSFCGSMGVQGFPTLKIIKPSKKTGKPVVEDYQGARTTKAIVDAVIEKIPNHVKRVTDSVLEGWLAESNDTAKAILFTEKGTTSALLRALAVDFLGGISFGQIRSKDAGAIELFGVDAFPTLVLLPGGDKEGLVYDGEMKKDPMVAFLGQIAPPNPDPAPKKTKPSAKKPTKDDKNKSAKDSSSFSEASSSHKSADASEAAASATSIVLEDEATPSESPEPIATPEDAPTPAAMPDVPPPIPTLATPEELQMACLGEKTSTCVLALLPTVDTPDSSLPESATLALASLAELTKKHAQRHGKLFPFYSVPALNAGSTALRSGLNIKGDGEIELVAVNGRRGWWRHYGKEEFGVMDIENWIDAIRLGEGSKQKIPEGVILAKHDEL